MSCHSRKLHCHAIHAKGKLVPLSAPWYRISDSTYQFLSGPSPHRSRVALWGCPMVLVHVQTRFECSIRRSQQARKKKKRPQNQAVHFDATSQRVLQCSILLLWYVVDLSKQAYLPTAPCGQPAGWTGLCSSQHPWFQSRNLPTEAFSKAPRSFSGDRCLATPTPTRAERRAVTAIVRALIFCTIFLTTVKSQIAVFIGYNRSLRPIRVRLIALRFCSIDDKAKLRRCRTGRGISTDYCGRAWQGRLM